jgi:DNA-directed RNA polymerase subunit RPC12/RpoP
MRVGRRAKKAVAVIIPPKTFERPVDMRDLTEDELKFIEVHEACPYCGSKEMYSGPTAGIMVNYVCAGCDSRFNIGSIYGGLIGQYIRQDPEIGQMIRDRED